MVHCSVRNEHEQYMCQLWKVLQVLGCEDACGRCRSIWYCHKRCQTEHWFAGHKLDCIEQKEVQRDPFKDYFPEQALYYRVLGMMMSSQNELSSEQEMKSGKKK